MSSPELDKVRGVVVAAMGLVEDISRVEPSNDALEAVEAIEQDSERAVVLLTAARNRLQCLDHFLAEECPKSCVEGQLQAEIDRFLETHVFPQPADARDSLGYAMELATSGMRVVIETDGTVRAT